MRTTLQQLFTGFVFLLMYHAETFAQDYASNKEKVYIQTNHVYFQPGEVLFLKAWVVRGEDQRPSFISNVLYLELLNPSGTLKEKIQLPITNGYAEGSFYFDPAAPGGIYKLRAYTVWMQNETERQYFVKEVTLQQYVPPRVLLKLDFPGKGYGPGDSVMADFSMRNIADRPIRNHPVQYIVSIQGKAIHTDTAFTNFEGKIPVRFRLPAELTTNDGQLTVAVAYDGYVESISRSIPIVMHKIDLQFMPEGGTMVNDINGYVAFKALNEDGKAADVKGKIIDQSGATVTEFSSFHFGMGKFMLRPLTGYHYRAIITSPAAIKQEFELPAATPDGVVMQVSKAGGVVRIELRSRLPRQVRLEATARNTTYKSTSIQLKQEYSKIEIPEMELPTGIVKLTVSTPAGLPLAERLVFANEEKRLQVTVSTDKPRYLPREKVLLKIQTLDEKGVPVPSNFSLAVVDDKLWTFADDKQDHILSWLLLSSELKGKVEEPQFYFRRDEPKASPALDLLLQTQGYRYFDYIDFVVQEKMIRYMPDQDNVLSGQILDSKNKATAARVFLMSTKTEAKALEINTGADGYFYFSNLEPNTSYYVFAQSKIDKKQQVSINILQNGIGYNLAKALQLKLPVSKAKTIATALNEPLLINGVPVPPYIPKEQQQQEREIVGMNVRQQEFKGGLLQEAVVTTALNIKRSPKAIGYSTAMVNGDMIAGGFDLAKALSGKVSGLTIYNTTNLLAPPNITLRGLRSVAAGNQPLFVVNGVVTETMALNLVNPADIENITILKDGAASALFGAAGANGAIIINSKKLITENIRFRVQNTNLFAVKSIVTSGTRFVVVRHFEAPEYATTKTDVRNDFRSTIYWNPVVQTDRSGTANVSFYNSDASTTFRILAEGISFKGELGRADTTYIAQDPLQIDVKIPPYLTVGDKALLSLVIRNNELTATEMEITVDLPDGLIHPSSFSHTVRVAADTSIVVVVPVQATRVMKDSISFVISSQRGMEKLKLPISAAGKGFPVTVNCSGQSNDQHHFVIRDPLEGSLEAHLRLYNDVTEQAMAGIESLLREPHGCFEQTSSSTYPNVLVLKYLQESGKDNPAIREKAMGYITEGYKRLIGFETPENGFEWFGKAPAHEALTAYGLLEFMEMKPFVRVDDNMLQRTLKFLLNRRDGKGGFEIKSGGYDQFASVPNQIANIYIVYALTQAGVGNRIQPEYQAALKQAIASDDTYQLSLMALASKTMNDADHYEQLMNLLARQDSLRMKTTVVNSRDISLRVETRALYAMALMKASNPDMTRVAILIGQIMKEKQSYGYGSTQGTILALQAIIEFAKLTDKLNQQSDVRFTMNGQTLSDSTIIPHIKEGDNAFAVRYEKEKGVPYQLEISYNTLTPPNSDKASLVLQTNLSRSNVKVGETVRMNIEVTNREKELQPMAIAKIGIPAGLSTQPWQLKELMEKNKVAYYEIFDNYLVFYWMGFAAGEKKSIALDLKAEIAGEYLGKASNACLYYAPEHKSWVAGTAVTIEHR